MVGAGKTKKQTFEQEKMSPKTFMKPKEKNSCMNKDKSGTMASGEVKMAAKHYNRLLNFLLNRAFLSVLRKNAA